MEIKYGHGYESTEEYIEITEREKAYLDIFGRGIVSGFFIMFASLFCGMINLTIAISVFCIGLLMVVVSGVTYDYHGGYDAEKSGKKFSRINKKEYFDILDTKTGKIKRTFVLVGVSEQ